MPIRPDVCATSALSALSTLSHLRCGHHSDVKVTASGCAAIWSDQVTRCVGQVCRTRATAFLVERPPLALATSSSNTSNTSGSSSADAATSIASLAWTRTARLVANRDPVTIIGAVTGDLAQYQVILPLSTAMDSKYANRACSYVLYNICCGVDYHNPHRQPCFRK